MIEATDRSDTGGVADLILASASRSRVTMLRNAGVPFTAMPPEIDEDALKLRYRDREAAELAALLAEAKALAVACDYPDSLVLGADQVLEFGDGRLDKPCNRGEARSQLLMLGGHRHRLISSASLMRGEELVWHGVDSATLEMRPLGEPFIERYLERIGDDAFAGPGAYRIEGLGAQLFTRIDGDFYTVMGLPLLAVLAELRRLGVIET